MSNERPVWMDAYEVMMDIAMDLADRGGELEQQATRTPAEEQEVTEIQLKLRFLSEVEKRVCSALRK